jgi:mannosylglycerate hydrolase MGH1-like protein
MKHESISHYADLLKTETLANYAGMLRESGGTFEYPFLTPGSDQYADVLWDWDSWLSNVALRQILLSADESDRERVIAYEKGCILNSLSWGGMDGWIPIFVTRDTDVGAIKPAKIYSQNMHKPTLAQHAAFLTKVYGGDAQWLRDGFYTLGCFINAYRNHHRHAATGLYYWQTDLAIGVDNDPSTYFRPPGSSASIYLNSLMYRELLAMHYLAGQLGLNEVAEHFGNDASDLMESVREHCWDERDGFYYSVDLNLLPVDHTAWLHQGQPRDWDCLIQRIGVWSGFLAMWAGIATQEQAERMVNENLENPASFNAEFGVRTLSRQEKMYNVRASGNPSSWLGPVWGISNYMTFRGLVRYDFKSQATTLAEKTIRLFGRDLERYATLHEYYQPDNGEPILNPGFQNWNYLVMNMIAWLEGQPIVSEF